MPTVGLSASTRRRRGDGPALLLGLPATHRRRGRGRAGATPRMNPGSAPMRASAPDDRALLRRVPSSGRVSGTADIAGTGTRAHVRREGSHKCVRRRRGDTPTAAVHRCHPAGAGRLPMRGREKRSCGSVRETVERTVGSRIGRSIGATIRHLKRDHHGRSAAGEESTRRAIRAIDLRLTRASRAGLYGGHRRRCKRGERGASTVLQAEIKSRETESSQMRRAAAEVHGCRFSIPMESDGW